jgi:hypothetical protein
MVFVDQGLRDETPELRAWWNDALESLRKNAANDTYSAKDREYYRKVAERYAQLLDLRTQ